MPNIRLVLTDIDDTIVPKMQHNVSMTVRDAIAAVEGKGIKVTPVSGRSYVHAKDTLDVLGVEGLTVLDGGATIFQVVDGTIVWKQWLDSETVRSIVTILVEYCDDLDHQPAHEMILTSQINIDGSFQESPYVFGLIEDRHKDIIVDRLRSIEGVSVNVINGVHPVTGVFSPAVQVTHHHANKFHGVEALRKIVNIPKEHTLGIGDGNNDLPLFQNAGLKIAMGNATDELKAEADHVVGTLEQDGFAEAMSKYVLVEQYV